MAKSLAVPLKPYAPAFAVADNTIYIHVPGLPTLPNAQSNAHWAPGAKDKKFWTTEVGKAAIVAKVQQRAKIKALPFEKAHVHFAICVGHNRRVDPDNLKWAVAKPALDGLKSIIIVDDSIDNIVDSYEYDRIYPRGFHIWITPLGE